MTDSFIPANKAVSIPGDKDSNAYIEVSPPFGVDMIQVIACTEQSGLHNFIEKMTPNAGAFKVTTRGLVMKKVKESIDTPQKPWTHTEKPRWSTCHTMIQTKAHK